MTQLGSSDAPAELTAVAVEPVAEAARVWAAEPTGYPRGAGPREPEPVEFTGSGREYFRIWVVNVCLSILTLGLYSPWAKVRKLHYFYRHTRLAGASFDYHGKPLAILKGRLVLGALVAAYYGLGYVAPIAAWAVGLVLFALSPWFFLKSLKFRMANTSYRGLRFRFNGAQGQAAGLLLLWPMLVACTCYLFLPHWLWKLKKFEYEETSYGRTRFTFGATPNNFYAAYLTGWLAATPFFLVGGLAASSLTATITKGDAGPAAPVALYAMMAAGLIVVHALVQPYISARLQRQIWSKLGLGAHRFECTLFTTPVVILALKNTALTLLTLGLYAPFAAVAMTKLRVESVRLLPGTAIEHFSAASDENVSAFADAVGDYADYDFGL